MALGVGILVSPHCVGMCGPLSCMILPNRERPGGDPDWNRTLYHAGRLLAYTAIGALAGTLGLSIVQAFGLTPIQYFPWFLAGLLLVFAFRLHRWFPSIPRLRRQTTRIRSVFMRIPRPLAGLGLGLSTPFLPCAPLYSMFWVALLSGSPLYGAEIALGFAMGTIPLLWFGQSLFSRLRSHLRPGFLSVVQRSTALLAAGIIVWRIAMAGGIPLASGFCGL